MMNAQLVIRVNPIWFVQTHLDPTPAAVTKDIAQTNCFVQVMIRWGARYKNSANASSQLNATLSLSTHPLS